LAGVLSLLPLLPRWFWDRLEERDGWSRWGPKLSQRWGTDAGQPSRELGWLQQGFGALILAWTLVWHVGVTVDPQYPGPQIGGGLGRALFLQQSYRMFARPSERTGWVEVEGQLLDGRRVDLLRDGGPVPAVRADESDPHVLRNPAKNFRWSQILRRMAYGSLPDGPAYYSRYLCREWNSTRSGSSQLDALEIRFLYRAQTSEVSSGYSTQVLWQHGCFR